MDLVHLVQNQWTRWIWTWSIFTGSAGYLCLSLKSTKPDRALFLRYRKVRALVHLIQNQWARWIWSSLTEPTGHGHLRFEIPWTDRACVFTPRKFEPRTQLVQTQMDRMDPDLVDFRVLIKSGHLKFEIQKPDRAFFLRSQKSGPRSS